MAAQCTKSLADSGQHCNSYDFAYTMLEMNVF